MIGLEPRVAIQEPKTVIAGDCFICRHDRQGNFKSIKESDIELINSKVKPISEETPIVGTDTVVRNQQAQPDKSARFKEKAENQASKVMTELEKLQKLSNRKYYTYTTEQLNELFGAIQSALDEAKTSFTSDNAEKKKLFTFSA